MRTQEHQPQELNAFSAGTALVKCVAYWAMHSTRNNTFRPAPKSKPEYERRRQRVTAVRPPESSCTRVRREMREKVGERVRENQAPASLPLLLWPIIHWVTVRPSTDQPWAAAPLMYIMYTGCHESTDLPYACIADKSVKSRSSCIARNVWNRNQITD